MPLDAINSANVLLIRTVTTDGKTTVILDEIHEAHLTQEHVREIHRGAMIAVTVYHGRHWTLKRDVDGWMRWHPLHSVPGDDKPRNVRKEWP